MKHLWKVFILFWLSSDDTVIFLVCLYYILDVFLYIFSVFRWLQQPSTTNGRKTPQIRTSTTCSSSWSSATAALERHPSSSGTQMTPSRQRSSARSASTSRWRQSSGRTRESSCRSGWVQSGWSNLTDGHLSYKVVLPYLLLLLHLFLYLLIPHLWSHYFPISFSLLPFIFLLFPRQHPHLFPSFLFTFSLSFWLCVHKQELVMLMPQSHLHVKLSRKSHASQFFAKWNGTWLSCSSYRVFLAIISTWLLWATHSTV